MKNELIMINKKNNNKARTTSDNIAHSPILQGDRAWRRGGGITYKCIFQKSARESRMRGYSQKHILQLGYIVERHRLYTACTFMHKTDGITGQRGGGGRRWGGGGGEEREGGGGGGDGKNERYNRKSETNKNNTNSATKLTNL